MNHLTCLLSCDRAMQVRWIVSSRSSPRAGRVCVETIRKMFSFNAVRITEISGCDSMIDFVSSAATFRFAGSRRQ
jgi:hypothetical protein